MRGVPFSSLDGALCGASGEDGSVKMTQWGRPGQGDGWEVMLGG